MDPNLSIKRLLMKTSIIRPIIGKKSLALIEDEAIGMILWKLVCLFSSAHLVFLYLQQTNENKYPNMPLLDE